MGQLQKYILRQMVLTTVLTTLALVCVAWLTRSMNLVDLIVYRNVSLSTFVGLTLLLFPTFLLVIGPAALFVATLFTYNKMTNDHELVILSASGLSSAFIARPAILLALILTVFGYLNSLYLTPSAYREFKDMQRILRHELSHILVQEGVFNAVIPGVTIFVRERSFDGNLQGLLIHDERRKDRIVTIMAQQGMIVEGEHGPVVLMVNGNRQEADGTGDRFSMFQFDRYTFDMRAFKQDQTILRRGPRELFLRDLFASPGTSDDMFRYRKLRMEGLYRLSSPLLNLCAVLAALGFLLTGGFNRLGQFRRILFAVFSVLGIHIAYYAARYVGERVPILEMLIIALPIVFLAVFVLMLTPFRPAPPMARAASP